MRHQEGGSGTRPWAWTLTAALALALLVAAAGMLLSRQEERIAERPPGNRVDAAFRDMARRIDRLERLWETALDDEAGRLLDHGLQAHPDGMEIVGVVQRSLLNPSFSGASRAHLRTDGLDPEWRPVLERFARKEPGEWVFAESDVLRGSGWIEMPGKPPAWWRGNGRVAVVLLLDPAAAAGIATGELHQTPAASDLADEPGEIVWRSPVDAPSPRTSRPDEILRHVSRFGDWTLERHYPVRVEVTWRMPVLAGSFALALLLAGGGIAIAASQRKAIRLAEERVSFVNRVSHELRTPLTNLLLNTDLALDGLPVDEGKLRRRLGLIREETGRLSRVVDNVLAFARIERGRHEAHSQSCDLGALIGEMRENFAPLFERKSIRCRYECAGGGSVPLDRDALAQILANLLSNVEKYAGESAEAHVAVSVADGQLVVEVTDNGPGIPPEARERVFRPFERAGSRVNEGASGTGLGLTISRELARGMGGRLELVPTPRGATFHLEIPMERSPA